MVESTRAIDEALEAELAEEDQQAMKAEKEELLHVLGQSLEEKKRRAIQYKTHIEARMLIDEAQYWGRNSQPATKEDKVAGKDSAMFASGAPSDNKTRSKTRIAAARIGDMLFPTNAPNWGMRPTPNPEIPPDVLAAETQKYMQENQPPAPPQEAGPDGQPVPQQAAPQVPPPDPDLIKDRVATKACAKMARRIKDVLAESQYPKEGRMAIMDACKLGTGIIKGPCNMGKVRRRYRPGQVNGERVDVLEQGSVPQPSVYRVSPWNFFPMPARNINESEWALEMHLPTATMLRKMVQSHGFDAETTAKLLKAGPYRGEVDSVLSQRAAITGDNSTDFRDNWAVWEYHGPIDRDDLEAWGAQVPQTEAEEEAAELESLYGEIWFCNSKILRMNIAMLDGDSNLPYHVFNYEEDETSIFGFGIPFIMRDDQYMIDTMWEAMGHNAAVSAGVQLAITKGRMVPADGSYNVRGPKLWYNTDEDTDIRDVIQAFVIPSTIENTMPLYQQAKLNADENTNLPLMMGDAKGVQSTGTSSGLSMLMNQQNIVQRQAAHGWDDNVTTRLIPRLYDWFMQHDPDPTIKGDYEVEVRGASYLLVRDTQAQHAQLLIQLAAQDPNLAAKLNLDELYRVYLGFMDIPIDLLLKTPEQVKMEQANQQPSPLEQLEMDEKRANINKLNAQAQAAGQGLGNQVTEKDMLNMDLEYAKLSAQQYAQNLQLEIEGIRRDTQLLRTAADEGIKYEQIRADMERFHTKLENETQLRLRKQSSDDYFKAAELRLSEFRDRLKSINLSKGFDTYG
jgi:hypothetical protein